jgi:hypothetical protein
MHIQMVPQKSKRHQSMLRVQYIFTIMYRATSFSGFMVEGISPAHFGAYFTNCTITQRFGLPAVLAAFTCTAAELLFFRDGVGVGWVFTPKVLFKGTWRSGAFFKGRGSFFLPLLCCYCCWLGRVYSPGADFCGMGDSFLWICCCWGFSYFWEVMQNGYMKGIRLQKGRLHLPLSDDAYRKSPLILKIWGGEDWKGTLSIWEVRQSR